MDSERFFGPNAAYAEDLYDRYLQDPESVDAETREFFKRFGRPVEGPDTSGRGGIDRSTVPRSDRSASPVNVQTVVLAARLARSIREYGHLAAQANPLGVPVPGDPMLNPATHGITRADLEALPATIVWPEATEGAGTCWDAIERLREIYCGPIGYEFDHIDDYEERNWLHAEVESPTRPRLTADERRDLLRRLSQVEAFERYLHTAFPGQKRFSIEGTDMLVPMLDRLIQRTVESGTREVLLGMSHRGRLNVLAHVLGKPYAAILAQFHSASSKGGAHAGEAQEMTSPGWTGDVKYHLGGHRTLGTQVQVELTLTDNPSHLEFVDPVVEGQARAAQDIREAAGPPAQDIERALAVTIHGDAAFPGEGIVAETLNLSQLLGYSTGGTVRFIVNNNLGFTTPASEDRSTLYASDVAKGFSIPIIHVNADMPEAAIWAVELAHSYRRRFHKDVIIDLVGYRRWGHNEGDEPAFTQPQMYAQIGKHPTVRSLYARELVDEGVVDESDAERMLAEARSELQRAREEAESGAVESDTVERQTPVDLADIRTAVGERELRAIHEALLTFPEEFQLHRTLQRVLERRRGALDREGGIDWGLAETLAFATILADGTPIRLTGQDTARGTFSHRHAVLVDPSTGAHLTPLERLPQANASFAVYNSPLTEAATLGFEYGYSVHAAEALVLWEAQFGDFSNVGQVIIDQFISSARAKWQGRPALALLLPHGYEGQGPEHSSARLERYLQLAAQDNIRVANCTTSAQYFHLLRVQAATLANDRRPLVVMTPKSLLRHPRAGSSLTDLIDGHFHPVLDDAQTAVQPERVRRIVFTSGKVAIDLLSAGENREDADRVAIVRVELLYPFPGDEVRHILERYSNATEAVWLQEEPRNMGAWTHIQPCLSAILPSGMPLTYVGRPERAATAEGSAEAHAAEQARIIGEAFDLAGENVQGGVQHVG